MQHRKWNRNTCARAAAWCKTRGDFSMAWPRAYRVALDNGWLGDYSWFVDGNAERGRKRNFWSPGRCLKVARSCSSLADFRTLHRKAYDFCLKNGLLESFRWLARPRNVWTEESCRKEAEKYGTLLEFIRGSVQAYSKSRRMGWLKGYKWLRRERKPKGYWNREHCLEEARNYQTIAGFRRGNWSAYIIAGRNGWLKDCTWFVPAKRGRKCV